MKITRKFHKDSDFDANSNMGFEIRMDSIERIQKWDSKQKELALKYLETCKEDMETQIKRVKAVC